MTIKVDRRDLILARLLEILGGLSVTLTTGAIAPGNFGHNRNELPGELIPGVLLLDADELKDPRAPTIPGRQGAPSSTLMKMSPEIYIVLDLRKPKNIDAGKDLNTARAEILHQVLHDTTLQQLTGSNGSITYDGCVTDLARNRTMQGQMGLLLTFTYPFMPGEFTAA